MLAAPPSPVCAAPSEPPPTMIVLRGRRQGQTGRRDCLRLSPPPPPSRLATRSPCFSPFSPCRPAARAAAADAAAGLCPANPQPPWHRVFVVGLLPHPPVLSAEEDWVPRTCKSPLRHSRPRASGGVSEASGRTALPPARAAVAARSGSRATGKAAAPALPRPRDLSVGIIIVLCCGCSLVGEATWRWVGARRSPDKKDTCRAQG